MTSEEKRRLLKEQYKRDLKERKAFLDKVEKLKRSKKLNDAVQNITSSLTDEDSEEWISKLNHETALTEAKLDMALDDANQEQKRLEKLAQQAEAEKFQALDLVQRMKREMGLAEDEGPAEEQKTSEEKTKEAEQSADASGSREQHSPEKPSSDASNRESQKPKMSGRGKTLGDF